MREREKEIEGNEGKKKKGEKEIERNEIKKENGNTEKGKRMSVFVCVFVWIHSVGIT